MKFYARKGNTEMKNLFINNELRDISVCGENLGGAIFDDLSVMDAKFYSVRFFKCENRPTKKR